MSQCRTAHLCHLPNEITAYVVKRLNVDDVFSLALSCRRFQGVIRDENICRNVLENHASLTEEYLTARSHKSSFARALRVLAKRRHAIVSADPFGAAAVAEAESFIYEDGHLVYLRGRELRILDLHASARQEIVINIRKLLDECLLESRGTTKYKFYLLRYAEGILSCRYTHAKPNVESWLVAFDIHGPSPRTVAQQLESTYKLFVRNNRDFLYFGTHSEHGEDGFRRWILRGYSFNTQSWFDQKIHLPDFVGSDLGSTICFEILGGFFYGLSNQNTFDVEGVDWTSHYHCFRFPVDQPRPEWTQTPSKDSLWRRKHAEGPIDDRWTFLRLEKDKTAGNPRIIESRKEWLAGSSSGRRTYYVQNLIFPPVELDHAAANSATAATIQANAGDFSTGVHIHSTQSSDTSGAISDSGFNNHEGFNSENPTRSPYNVHPGDDGAEMLMFTLSNTHIRSYYASCSTFIDLVNDPSPADPNTARFRIRAGSRRLIPADLLEPREKQPQASLYPEGEIKRLYETSQIKFWPSDSEMERAGSKIAELYRILNPPTRQGKVIGTWDGRSLLYATGGNNDELKTLVFLSFDSSIHLHGWKSWRGGSVASGLPEPASQELNEDIGDARSKNKGKEIGNFTVGEIPTAELGAARGENLGASEPISQEGICTQRSDLPVWAELKPARYLSLAGGIGFFYE